MGDTAFFLGMVGVHDGRMGTMYKRNATRDGSGVTFLVSRTSKAPRCCRVPVGLVAAFVALWSVAAEAQDCTLEAAPVGGALDLSTESTTQRRSPAVAYNSTDDEYLVIWFDTRNPGNNDIFGQRLSGTGQLQDDNIAIMEFVDAQIDPFVAYNSVDNGYLAAWRTQQPGYFNDSRGRHVAADGTLPGGDFFISDAGNEISIAYSPVVNEFLHSGRSPGIRGRRVPGTGPPIGGDIIIATAGAPAPNGQVAYNGNADEYFATWRNQTDRNLQGRRVSSAGVPLGNPILISSTFPASGRAASVAFDPDNDRYLVVFGEFQEPNIFGQFVSGAGVLIGGNFLIATGVPGSTNPYMAYSDADDVFLVVWRRYGNIVAQVLLDDGSFAGDPATIASGTVSGDPRLAYNGTSGEFLAVWTDDRNIPEGEQDIFAQRIAIRDLPVTPGDLDCDGDCDVFDFAVYLDCYAGPGEPDPPPGCDPSDFANADMDADGDVDFADAGQLLLAVTVP